MATHSSILAWRIPWTEEPGEQQFMGLQSQTISCTHTNHKLVWVTFSIAKFMSVSTSLGDLLWGGRGSEHQPLITSSSGRASDRGKEVDVLQTLPLAWLPPQDGFYQSSYHFDGFKEENAPQEGHLMIAQTLHLISWIFYRGAWNWTTSFSKQASTPRRLKQMKSWAKVKINEDWKL